MTQLPEFWYLVFDNELAEQWIAAAEGSSDATTT
jgi:hypothetical protein